jgi:hypothetical protein
MSHAVQEDALAVSFDEARFGCFARSIGHRARKIAIGDGVIEYGGSPQQWR